MLPIDADDRQLDDGPSIKQGEETDSSPAVKLSKFDFSDLLTDNP